MLRTLAPLLTVVVLAASGTRAAALDEPRLELRPRYTPGQENRFVIDMRSRTESQLLDETLVKEEEYRQRLRMKRRVVSADESGAVLELTYEAVAVRLAAGSRSVYFDTEGMNDGEAEAALGDGIRNAMARTFTVRVDALGRVQSVEGNEQDGTKIASANLIADDLFSRSFLPMYGVGKEPAATALGETWQIRRRPAPSQTGQFTHTITSRLSAIEPSGRRAIIDISGSTSLEPSEKAREANAEITESSISGQQVWSLFDGVCDRAAFRQAMQVRANVEVTKFNTLERKIRPRRVDTLLHVVIQRIDPDLPGLPPLPDELVMPALEPPSPQDVHPAEPAAEPAGH